MQRDDSYELCQICINIDFSQYFQNSISSRTDDDGFVGPTSEALRLGTIEELFRKCSTCRFCYLVLKALCIGRYGQITTLDDLINRYSRQGNKIACWMFSYCYAINTPLGDQKAYRVGIATQLSEENFLFPEDHQADIQLFSNDAKSLTGMELFYGRALPTQFDMQLAQKWLSHCENDHKELCEFLEGDPEPQGLKVINVKTMSLCHLPTRARYIALSYCWASQNPFMLTKAIEAELFQPGSITKRLQEFSPTIQDAIDFVSKLNEVYLWIDSICIVQDCDDDKRTQIYQMDKVYSSAVLTLVSASPGSIIGPSSDLPRYRSNPGAINHQVTEQIKGLQLSVPLPTLSFALESSRWNNRAWTLQESLLSKRLLYFTKFQVYFQCSCCVFCEDSIGESSQHAAQVSPASNLWRMGGMQSTSADQSYLGSLHLRRKPYSYSQQGLREYEELVTRYTSRDLSNSSDILNAFTGLQAVMKITMSSDFWYGLPEAQLDSALLWTLTGRHKRRNVVVAGLGSDHFPSWTWAGWESTVELGSYFHITAIRSEIDWYLISQHGAAFLLSIDRLSDEIVDFVEEHHKQVRPEGTPSDTIMSTIESRFNVNPLDNAWRYPKYLACWTTLASFQLTGDTQSLGSHGKLWEFGLNLQISNSKGEWVGSILMEEQWVADNLTNRQEFDFILMSRSEEFFDLNPEPSITIFDGQLFTMTKWCFLNVMMIQRQGNIGTRLGVGLIHEDAWIAAGPKASFIKLL